MEPLRAAKRAAIAGFALTIATTALAADDWSQGVVISAEGQPRIQSKDDRAIYACAQTMMREMFPDARRIRVVTNPRDRQVFNSSADSALPGVQMAVLLKASDPDSGKLLGTAECDVSPDSKVQSLKPGVKDLPLGTTPP
jgi:hypothetical protein